MRPRRVFVHGKPGVGKSTWAASAPGVLFFPIEDGANELDVAKLPVPQSVAEIDATLRDIVNERPPYKWLVFDTVDWVERLIHKELIAEHNKSIEEIGGGYGKGQAIAAKHFAKLMEKIDFVRVECGMSVIMLAHTQVKRFEDPEVDGYDRYEPRLDKRVHEYLIEWADEVFFGTYKKFTKQSEGNFGKTVTKARGTGERILRTDDSRSTCTAKNRLGMPSEIEFTWEAYASFLPEELL